MFNAQAVSVTTVNTSFCHIKKSQMLSVRKSRRSQEEIYYITYERKKKRIRCGSKNPCVMAKFYCNSGKEISKK